MIAIALIFLDALFSSLEWALSVRPPLIVNTVVAAAALPLLLRLADCLCLH
jgi:hypothetical protein